MRGNKTSLRSGRLVIMLCSALVFEQQIPSVPLSRSGYYNELKDEILSLTMVSPILQQKKKKKVRSSRNAVKRRFCYGNLPLFSLLLQAQRVIQYLGGFYSTFLKGAFQPMTHKTPVLYRIFSNKKIDDLDHIPPPPHSNQKVFIRKQFRLSVQMCFPFCPPQKNPGEIRISIIALFANLSSNTL